MILAHASFVPLATQYLEAAGFLHFVRNAVLVILLIVFLIGGFLGFLVGRTFGRRR
jgi:hypothetical protein